MLYVRTDYVGGYLDNKFQELMRFYAFDCVLHFLSNCPEN